MELGKMCLSIISKNCIYLKILGRFYPGFVFNLVFCPDFITCFDWIPGYFWTRIDKMQISRFSRFNWESLCKHVFLVVKNSFQGGHFWVLNIPIHIFTWQNHSLCLVCNKTFFQTNMCSVFVKHKPFLFNVQHSKKFIITLYHSRTCALKLTSKTTHQKAQTFTTFLQFSHTF